MPSFTIRYQHKACKATGVLPLCVTEMAPDIDTALAQFYTSADRKNVQLLGACTICASNGLWSAEDLNNKRLEIIT